MHNLTKLCVDISILYGNLYTFLYYICYKNRLTHFIMYFIKNKSFKLHKNKQNKTQNYLNVRFLMTFLFISQS